MKANQAGITVGRISGAAQCAAQSAGIVNIGARGDRALARHQANVVQLLADGRERAALADAFEAAQCGPDDQEIVGLLVDVYDLTPAEAVERLAVIDLAAARRHAAA